MIIVADTELISKVNLETLVSLVVCVPKLKPEKLINPMLSTYC